MQKNEKRTTQHQEYSTRYQLFNLKTQSVFETIRNNTFYYHHNTNIMISNTNTRHINVILLVTQTLKID